MKQKIEIEVPEGKKAVWEDGQIKFVDIEHWRDIKTFEDAYEYYVNNKIVVNLLYDYRRMPSDFSYENRVIKLRIIIAALTNNEKLSLTKGNIYYPVIQFCLPDRKDNCWGDKIIGKIKIENQKYLIMGSIATYGSYAGLGFIDPYLGLSNANASVGFIKVSSKEIAEHLSTYFGKLIFDVTYGGCNCDYEWI